MQQRVFIAGMAAALLAVALAVDAFAGEIRKGATAEVRSNSIWFEDAAKLTRWQELRKSGNTSASASYQEDVLAARDAWQFNKQLTVKVLGYEPQKNQVKVEMKTPGRLSGSKWLLDAGALLQ